MAGNSDYYPRLLEQRRAEKASPGLAKIPSDFYSATQALLGQLRQMLESELKENPTSKKVELIRSQYQRARAHARDVMDWRMSKIATLAVQVVSVGTEPENMLPEERVLMDELAKQLDGFRNKMNPYLEAMPLPPPPKPRGEEASSPAAPADQQVRTAAPQKQGQLVVRVLKDGLPFIVGEGDTIELHKEDIAALPKAVAKILVAEGIAELVELH
jgi:DNA replication initiation complex subunit (GINS family)